MRYRHSLRELLHQATHRVPGVPAHAERPAGHQGRAWQRPGGGWRHSSAHHRPQRPSRHHGFNHSPARPPRLLVVWQARIARLFGQEL